VLLVPDRRHLLPEYCVLALYGNAVREEITLRSRSTTAAHLNVGEIGDLRIPMPDLTEQSEAIAEFAVARERNQALRAETAMTTATVREYRDALITEAVNGRLDLAKLSDARMDESLGALREGETPEVLIS
jgi:type I restriction enzyme S subunit